MKRRYNGGSSNRNSRKGKKRRTKDTSVSLNLDLEDHLPSSDFSYNSDDDIPYRPSEGIDSDDSLTFGLDDLEPENAVPFRRRWKKRKGRAWKKKMRGTQKASIEGINGGDEDEELEEIDFGDPSWKGKKKKKGKQARKGRKEGDPPLIWEVLEEENERWIDAHENDDPNLDDHEETVPEMADPPPDLVMPLLRFQKEWLAWAVKQEESFIRGGILADEMGMGKTIQAISLVLATRAFCTTDLDFGSPSSSLSFCPTDLHFGNPSSSSSPALPKIKGTLVICPLVAVVQWVNEITKFTSEGSVKVLVYHGAKREKGIDQFFKYDFILTTYSIVEADYRKNNMPPKERCVWCGKLFYPNKMTIHLKYFCGPSAVKTAKQSKQAKKKHVGNVGSSKKKFDVIEEEEEDVNNDNKVGKGKGSAKGKKPGRAPKKPGIRYSNDNSAARSEGSSARKSVLHSVKWERIILDEAHYIKDRRSSTARAVLSLQSSYKWALSGTPLQNRVGELYSLIRFLQISPYSYYYCKDCDCKSLDYSYTTDCPNCVHKANRHFCWWNRYVAKPIQTSGYVNDGRRAMVFLKHKLLKSVVLRRTKKGRAADLALPPRIVSLRRDYLDNTEEDFYEALYTRSQAQFNTYVEAGTLMNNYAHIFDLLTRLRQYYLKTGGCKFGKACRYNHPQEKAVEGELLELNFLGLPIRPGERECPFYMRTGSCKFAANCRFHHPDPTAVGGCDLLSGYHNDRTLPLHTSAALQAPMTSWSLQRASNESVPYMDASPPYVPMMPLPPGVHPNPEWNGYQVPVISTVFPPKRNVQPPSASVVNDLIKEADNSTHQQKTTVDEFPERPGQPDCQYFMRNGDCKFRSACRYHHPKTQASKSSVCDLSPMGLPLRPDQVICTYYSRYGICKFGPACKFDHPINKGYSDSPTSPVVTVPAALPSYKPLMSKLDRVPDCGNSSDDLS